MINNKNYAYSFIDQLTHYYQYYNKNPWVLTLTFQITEKCNLNCSYCYQHNKSNKKMTFETAKKAIDLILANNELVKSYIKADEKIGVILDFIGGDPLLEIELMDKITDYFIHKMIELKHPWLTKYRISVGTNGLLYFNEKVQNFLKKHKNHTSFNITLDGSKELHDMCRRDYNNKPSYDIVEKAVLHYMNNYSSMIGTKLTISPENIDYLFDGVKNFINLNLYTIYFNPVYENVWNIELAKKYYNQLKKIIDYLFEKNLEDKIFISQLDQVCGTKDNQDKNYCGGTGHMLAINPDGNFYPCIRYMESSLGENQEPYIIGDIYNGIGQEEKHKKRVEILNAITKTSQSSQKCLECPIDTGCGWCSGYNYEVFGTPNKRATFICEMHQARVLAKKYYNNKIRNKYPNYDFYPLNIPKEWALKIIDINEYENLLKEANYNDS